jgi:putative flippase GtrA
MNNTSFLERLFKDAPSNTYIELFRYLIAGGVALVADAAVLYFLTEYLGVYYLLSSIVGFCVGLIVSYIINVIWVFTDRKIENKTIERVVFATISLVGLLLTSLFMWVFTSLLLFHYLYSKIITTVIVFVWNFAAKKKSLFSK